MAHPTLTFLVLRAQTGDRRALDELLRAVQPEVLGYLTRLLRDGARAEDVLQDTLVIVCRKIGYLREARFFRTWVYRIATREAMRAAQARGGEALDGDAPDGGASSPGLAAADREAIERVLARVETLPPNSRAVVLLHYMAGLSLSAAAAVMGVPEGTAKSRLAYALGLLRRTEGGSGT